VGSTLEMMKLLAGQIQDLSEKLNNEAEAGVDVDLEDYINLQGMAESLSACVLAQREPAKQSDREDVLGALRRLSVHDRLWVKRCLAADEYEDFLRDEEAARLERYEV